MALAASGMRTDARLPTIGSRDEAADAQMSAALVEAAQHPAATPRTSLVDPTPAPADS